jgi:hypothetical protein
VPNTLDLASLPEGVRSAVLALIRAAEGGPSPCRAPGKDS